MFYSAFGHRPETWDNAAVPRPRGRGDPLGAVRRRRRRPRRSPGNCRGALRDYDATGVNGPNGDPDGDGRTNGQEQAAGTHPRGFAQRYLAEGATSNFFETRIGVLNPSPTFTSRVQLRYQLDNGTVQTDQVTLAPRIAPDDDAAGRRRCSRR